MAYRSPVADIRFILDKVVPLAPVAATERFAEATPETVEAVLTEAGKLCDEVMAPLLRAGDLHPARLENGVVRTSPGFREAYQQIAEGGWVAVAAPQEYGGMGLPQTICVAVNDMMSGANLALQLNPLLTQGQIEALEHHASEEIKALYIPKLISGEWSGTMNLTEPQAGSDVGALRSRAEPLGDGTYAITGQKIFISWGDSDVTENICHLVLARLPDASPGTKGISLFMVPKYIPDAAGKPGVANTLGVVSLEHKMGLHGSPTCVMSFEAAKGWMVGEPGKGMAAMFTMMNNARLAVGVQGIGVAEAAFQQALAYAQERVQFSQIIQHADVRRMLAEMRAEIFAARSIALACAVALDLGRATGEDHWLARAALLTPIAKAYGTDTGIWVAEQGVQVHGGMGFIEQTGAAQYCRDVRVTAIYEGTNGIQAMDLAGRKMADDGRAAFRLLQEIEDAAKAAREALPDLAEAVWQSAETLREHTEGMIAQGTQDRFAGAVPYLRAFARVLGAHYHLRAALEGGAHEKLAAVYIRRLLPQAEAALAAARAGAVDLFALSPEDLGA
ncbi:acyl-CoA dehydrogenase [Rhodobacter capsulatus]|jgi:alkylation response protein AidB-like acyl-CoA dehydrogenase|uniref:3-methylmercaptopropionyl-CoA dehydrogenase n=1 Tax=Rhodobacter capsulatus (strain ATCC BAA-309 / NBRC 16581 / SB1003) TaxID=272942 RepID=D5AMA0_RHOCB|nr:acyl-CoA dehydrogenase [Rhodobacter capsulatus]ADE84170.1 acyl-CoA dehydrogenase domain protein [Rhodobacter capsulatus SB 1003]MDS0925854.1 acyl-CoA dehydrogenase [Rhodobacter capsulatus]TQD36113.1 acyl-CoA dehydrogenase [Rhodobacter capsulatus]